MIETRLTLPPDVEELFEGLTEADVRKILTNAAEGFTGPGGLLEQHWEKGQSQWGEPSDRYAKHKERKHGTREKFVKSGEALKAIKGGKSQYKTIRVRKDRAGRYTVEVVLVRMEGGKNIYSIAQAGGKGGPLMMISENQEGDLEYMKPFVEEALVAQLRARFGAEAID